MTKHTIFVIGGLAMAAVASFLAWRAIGDFARNTGLAQNRPAPIPPVAAHEMPPEVEEIMPAKEPASRQVVSYRSTSDDVPGWRIRTNYRGEAYPPNQPWRSSDLIKWRVALNGEGHSSPIVVGDTVYLTIADGDASLSLVAYDFESGICRWRQPVSRQAFPPRHEKTSDAASTPCSDGERIFVAWATRDTVHLDAFQRDGTHLWTTPLGPFSARWGFTASPLWAHGVVVVGADNSASGFLAAVDAADGSIVWRRRRRQAGDESYSSPVMGGPSRDEVVMAGLDGVDGFSLHHGRLLWHAGGISSTAGMTPVIIDDICVAASGFPSRRMVALRVVGGDRARVETLWHEDRESEVPYVPTPLVSAGRLYVLHDDGVAHCRDLMSGAVAWKRRLGGSFSASPVLVDGEILCASESGRCVLVNLADGEIVHEFTVPGGCFATPVVVRGQVLIRTTEVLLCFPLRAESLADTE